MRKKILMLSICCIFIFTIISVKIISDKKASKIKFEKLFLTSEKKIR